jgi:hypothetical protein
VAPKRPRSFWEPQSNYHAQRLTRGEAAAVVEHDVEAAVVEVGAVARGMRGDQHIGGRPERMICRQGLYFEDVEGCPGDLVSVKRVHKVVEAHSHAPADVDRLGKKTRSRQPGQEVARLREGWLETWKAKLTSKERPINPYRVISEFMNVVDPKDAIVTHDSGSPRDQILPFYMATHPRGYIGWGKSHQLAESLVDAIDNCHCLFRGGAMSHVLPSSSR